MSQVRPHELMESGTPAPASPTEDVEARAHGREDRLAHRWVSTVVIFILDTLWKAINIIFWYLVITPVYRIWDH